MNIEYKYLNINLCQYALTYAPGVLEIAVWVTNQLELCLFN